MAARTLQVSIVGDASSLTRSFKDASKQTESFGKKFSGMGKAMALGAGAAGVGAAFVALKGVVGAAQEAEKSQAAMEAALRTANLSYKDHAKVIGDAISKTSKLAGVDDEELQNAFTSLVRSTGNVKQSMQGMTLAADIAAARHISLEAATKVVEKGLLGNEGAFRRVGLVLGKNTTATETLRLAQEKFGGSAEAVGKTAAGSQAKLGVAFENLQESLGQKLLPVLAKLAVSLTELIAWTEQNWPKFQKAIEPVLAVAEKLFKNLATTIKDIAVVVGAVIVTVQALMDGDWAKVWEGLKKIGTGAIKILGDTLLALPKLLAGVATDLGAKALDAIGAKFADLKNYVRDSVIGSAGEGGIVGFFAGLPGKVWGAISGAWADLTEPFRTAFNGITGWLRDNWKTALITVVTGLPGALWRGLHSELGEKFTGKLKDAFGTVKDWIKEHVVDAIVKFFEDLPGRIVDMLKGLAGKVASILPFVGGPSGGRVGGGDFPVSPHAGVTKKLWDEIGVGQGMGLTLTSGLRPGDPGDHGRGHAIDMSGPASTQTAYALAMFGRAGLKDVIYGGLNFWQDNGRMVQGWAGNEALRSDHYDHVHVSAFDRGGWLMPGLTLAQNLTGRPEAVIPLGRGGGAGVTVNVNVHGSVISDGELARKVRDGFNEALRANPRLGATF